MPIASAALLVASDLLPRATAKSADAVLLRPTAIVSSLVALLARPIAICVLPASRPPFAVASAMLF